MVEQKQKERETQINKTIDILNDKLRNFKIKAEITGRAKNFYSVYMKITKRGVIFDEIYDLTAVRVIVDDLKDCKYKTIVVCDGKSINHVKIQIVPIISMSIITHFHSGGAIS